MLCEHLAQETSDSEKSPSHFNLVFWEVTACYAVLTTLYVNLSCQGIYESPFFRAIRVASIEPSVVSLHVQFVL